MPVKSSPAGELMNLDLSSTMHHEDLGIAEKWLQMKINIWALIMVLKVRERERAK